MPGGPAVFPFPPSALPAERVGIGLRAPYYREILEDNPPVGWLEIHPENYFGGGMNRHLLRRVRARHQVSFHAVGLSLGSAQPVCEDHLRRLKELAGLYDPFLISDHASWSASGNAHLGDLLPLPYTRESLDALCRNVARTQEVLGRRILVENPSTYVAFAGNEMEETDFLNEAARKTGCGLLLDINNIFVQAVNHHFDPFAYIDAIGQGRVEEMHLAGHTARAVDGGEILVDTHNRPVRTEVWDLYAHALRRFGPVPTLIEWDQDFPPLAGLLAEAGKARDVMRQVQRERESHAAE